MVGPLTTIKGTDFVCQVKCTIFWLKRGLNVHLNLFLPDFSKSTFEYLLFTKVIRKHGSRRFTAINFLLDAMFLNRIILSCLIFETFATWYYKCFCLFRFSIIFWPKWFFHDLSDFLTQNACKIKCFGLKSTRLQKVLRGTFWKVRHIHIQIYYSADKTCNFPCTAKKILELSLKSAWF